MTILLMSMLKAFLVSFLYLFLAFYVCVFLFLCYRNYLPSDSFSTQLKCIVIAMFWIIPWGFLVAAGGYAAWLAKMEKKKG